jgi:phage-related holin
MHLGVWLNNLYFGLKKHLYAFSLSIGAIFAPTKPLLLAVGTLIVIDTITGVLAARKRGENFSSSALRRTISKMLVYQTAILTGFLLEKYLVDFVAVSKIVAASTGIVEFTSIVENLSTLHGKPILQDVIKKLGSKNDTEDPKP